MFSLLSTSVSAFFFFVYLNFSVYFYFLSFFIFLSSFFLVVFFAFPLRTFFFSPQIFGVCTRLGCFMRGCLDVFEIFQKKFS